MAMNDDMPKKAGLKLGAGRPSSTVGNSKSTRPKNVNKNIKVSQSEINSIKKLGMKKALSIAAMNKGSEQAGAVASFGEGVRRLYGETRYQNAVYTPKASPGPVASNFSYSAPKGPSNFTYSAPKSAVKKTTPAKKTTTTKNKVYNPNRDSAAAKAIRKIGRTILPGF
jgi:DNA uptake protein ComE-like DNA-binding protein